MNLGTRKIRFKSHYLAGLFLIALVTAALYLTGDNGGILEDRTREKNSRLQEEQTTYKEEGIARNDSVLSCNLFSGRWVFDNISYPLYKEGQCSFMLHDYACEKYGRKDVKYQNWRWQPHDCDLPRFNGTALLEKIRGKKLVFVGDSLNKNQWTSMLCLIESSLHQSSPKLVIRKGNLFTFQATVRQLFSFPFFCLVLSYFKSQCVVAFPNSSHRIQCHNRFYWSPLLVESNCDDPENHRMRDRIIRITAIEKHARHWTDADILIFDSFMWWLEPTMTLLWGSFGSSDAIYKTVEMRLRRYEMALNTWSDWLEININRTKTKLFFMSLSPYHFQETMWRTDNSCCNKTEPIFDETYWASAVNRSMMRIAESTIDKLEQRGLKLEYLNITQLSVYREDAHPSTYRTFWHTLTKEQLKDTKRYADCLHWCLPGVPDVWNQILYAYIMKS
ncbi:hypothetical protein Pfo_029234 [Paulownia fortunei]|nr:hypothetical protein Pfo_029234 [Paulownia fortunei]